MKFYQYRTKDKKVTAFQHEGRLGTTKQRYELPLFFASIRQALRRWKALVLGSLNMQFQQDWPKGKKRRLFNFFARKLRKNCSTELYNGPLEGSTTFLYCSSLDSTSLKTYRSAELKYAILRTGRKNKILRCSCLFLSTVFKHALLEGSTFYFNTAAQAVYR